MFQSISVSPSSSDCLGYTCFVFPDDAANTYVLHHRTCSCICGRGIEINLQRCFFHPVFCFFFSCKFFPYSWGHSMKHHHAWYHCGCIPGLETKESVGGFHQVLSANKATEFPGVTTASSSSAQWCVNHITRPATATFIPCHGFHWESGSLLS